MTLILFLLKPDFYDEMSERVDFCFSLSLKYPQIYYWAVSMALPTCFLALRSIIRYWLMKRTRNFVQISIWISVGFSWVFYGRLSVNFCKISCRRLGARFFQLHVLHDLRSWTMRSKKRGSCSHMCVCAVNFVLLFPWRGYCPRWCQVGPSIP